MAPTEPLLTKKQVANLLNISVRTLNRLMAEGFIRYIKMRGAVRFAVEEVEQVFRRSAGGCECGCDCACGRFYEIIND
jgi:excisionase family DNA binding protein